MRIHRACFLLLAAAAIPEARAGVDAEGPPALKARGSILPEGDIDLFRFDAEAGTTLSFKLLAARKAPLEFAPVLVGPDEAVVPLAGAKDGGRKFSVTKLLLPATGSYRLEVAGSGAGDYSLKLKAKVRGVKTVRLDVRASSLGRPGGGETWVSRLIGPEGGTVEVVDAGSDLLGAALTVPAGAIPESAPVALGSAAPPDPGTAAWVAAGPGARVELPVLAGPGEATVFLPLDPALTPLGTEAGDIAVLAAAGPGPTAAMEPDSVEPDLLGLSLTVTGSTLLAPAAPGGMLPVNGAGDATWWYLGFHGELSANPENDDSRERAFQAVHGTLAFGGGGTLQASLAERTVRWLNLESPGQPPILGQTEGSVASFVENLPWEYGGDGESVTLAAGEVETATFRPARGGRIAVGGDDPTGDPRVGAALALLRPSRPPATADLAGKWHYMVLGVSADSTYSSGVVQVSPYRVFATLDLRADGSAVLSGRVREVDAEGSDGRPLERTDGGSLKGSWRVEEGGTAVVDLRTGSGDPENPLLRFHPAEGWQVAFGYERDPVDRAVEFAVIVREGSEAALGDLEGEWTGRGFGVDLRLYSLPVPSVLVPDLGAGESLLDATVQAGGSLLIRDRGRYLGRDESAPGGVGVDTWDETFTLPLSVSRRGSLTLKDPEGSSLVGAVSPDGDFLMLLTNPASAGADYMFLLLVRKP